MTYIPTTNHELPQHLIERALSLTGKTMEDMHYHFTHDIVMEFGDFSDEEKFSIEKFAYYLLSPEFQYEYHKAQNYNLNTILTARNIGDAISEYQKGNEEPLVEFLTVTLVKRQRIDEEYVEILIDEIDSPHGCSTK